MFCLSMNPQNSARSGRVLAPAKNFLNFNLECMPNILTDFFTSAIMLCIKLGTSDVMSFGGVTMKHKELKKLKRTELLELLLEQTRRAENLEKSLAEATRQLQSRELQVSEAGSLAEAALKLNDVFSSAQNAADQYLQNVRSRNVVLDEAHQEAQRIITEAKQQAEQLTQKTQKECTAMREKAQKDTQRYWDNLTKKLAGYMDEHPELKKQLLKESIDRRL